MGIYVIRAVYATFLFQSLYKVCEDRVEVRIGTFPQSSLGLDTWPSPQPFLFMNFEELQSSVVVQVSIDTGRGTTKFMAKFVSHSGSQYVADIMLLDESQEVRQIFL